MSWEPVLDVVGGVLILLGAALALTAAIGLVRLPDVLNRMHAASKPQTLGFLLLCVGLSLILRDGVIIDSTAEQQEADALLADA